jgi:hypothetical protein
MRKLVLCLIFILLLTTLVQAQYLGGNGRGDNMVTLSSSPLPVELITFAATVRGSSVILKWETETEVSNYGFEIERSVNDNWGTIGFVEGHGNSNSPKDYLFIDNNLVGSSKFKYRLKQIDNDGKYEYSDEIEVEVIPTVFALYQNYPNPFNPSTKIKVQFPQTTQVRLAVYNMLGELVSELANGEYSSGVHEFGFNAEGLASGIYVYRVESPNFIDTKKMVLLR